MILEHVHISVSPAKVSAYLEAFEQARPRVQGQPGCHSCRLLPKVDAPGDFLLLIEWESKAQVEYCVYWLYCCRAECLFLSLAPRLALTVVHQRQKLQNTSSYSLVFNSNCE